MTITPPPLDSHTLALIRMAVREDMGYPGETTLQGDKTVDLAIPPDLRGSATIVARRAGVIAGTYLLSAILREYAADIGCTLHTSDGTSVKPQQSVATLTGPVRALLSAERVVLNFLGHLSGVASLTRLYVDTVANAVANPEKRPAICDTRKTTPAYRALDKYAVRCGGGTNHRIGLYDGVMLKDNHLAALRDRLGTNLSLAQLTAQIRAALDPAITLWLEVDTLEQLQDALPQVPGDTTGADIILLDNFSPGQMRQAVAIRNASAQHRPLLEASGGITLANLGEISQTCVDRVSIGALTHSAPILDLSMEFH